MELDSINDMSLHGKSSKEAVATLKGLYDNNKWPIIIKFKKIEALEREALERDRLYNIEHYGVVYG